MNTMRHSSARVLQAPVSRFNARRLPSSMAFQKRTATTTSGEPVPYGGYPKRIWVITGAGAGLMYYLWHRGHANAKAAAGKETQAHHGPKEAATKQ